MKVRYQIIVEVTADGMMGPLKVLNLIENWLKSKHVQWTGSDIKEDPRLVIGKVRVAAVYPVAQDDEKAMVTRVPGSDQSRQVEEVRDPRIT